MIYYLLLGLFGIVILSATFMESMEGALFGLVFLGGATYWWHPDTFSASNLPSVWTILIVIGVYVVAGGLWSVFKWHRWLVSQASQIQDGYDKWKAEDKKAQDWSRAYPDTPRTNTAFEDSYHSQTWWPSKNKDKILYWISWWPFSALWYVVYDLVNGVWAWVYAKLEGVYKKISSAAFSRVVK